MSLKNQILVIFLCFLLSFVFIRSFLSGIKRYQLNNSAYKKRKKGETFLEWLFYSRYKEEIPKILRVFYFAVLFVHLSCIIICLFLYMIKLPMNIGGAIATATAVFDAVWMFVIKLLFWQPRRPGCAYKRWITKKRGQKPK